ncbi:MAG: tetratricopeptide repeat protein [Gemmatimonadales bacterium]
MNRPLFCGALALLGAIGGRPAAAQTPAPCVPLPAALASTMTAAWDFYRTNRIEQADSAFRVVTGRCPADAGANAGLGYTSMRRGELDNARRFFARSLGTLPGNYDALTGIGMAAYRAGDPDAARRHFEDAARRFPGDSLTGWYLDRLGRSVSKADLPPVTRPAALRLDARTGQRIFEVPGRDGWEPFWIKGVNIGAALPGKHPSEFPPDDGTYQSWFDLVSEMGANTIRVYTIHPPHFYRALAEWNERHPDRVLWLIHGVWTELPPGRLEEQYDDPVWRTEFRDEQKRVVDLLHGHAAIEARPGHSSGLYTADVSRWVLAYITGREWEPYSVVEFSKLHPDRTSYRGRFIQLDRGNAAEAWLAEESDHLLGYEVDTYNTIRPIAYTNWPTLDPLHHPTESTREEEARLRKWDMPEEPREFDNDAIGLDAVRMRATAANPAGTFASFHAYPYYPDFMVLDPGYARARSPEGPSSYYGYLRELVEHHGDMPVVISEYGVPSSRGNAHFQPQGWHHGGHSERDQAAIDARLTRDIHAAGGAGAVLFAVIDEWFKKNWVVIDFEVPLERNRLWLNALDAEQNYGILAMRAGRKEDALTIDGRGEDWGDRGRTWGRLPDQSALPAPLRIRDVRIRSDEAYVYLRLDVGAIDWSRGRYLVGIDTYRADLGGLRLPRTGQRCEGGLEFVVDLVGPEGSQLLVDREYNLYRTVPLPGSNPPRVMQVYNRPWEHRRHDDLQWDTLVVETNRARVGRDGTVYSAQTYQRNRLLHARQTDNSLADWYADPATGTIELRLGWGMLQVLDPSSRLVLHGADGGGPAGAETDGFRFVVQSYDPARPDAGGALIGCGPNGGAPFEYTWPAWEVPNWHEERKPLFEAMRDAFRAIRPAPGGRASGSRR